MSIAKMPSYNYEELYEDENFVSEALADILKFLRSSQALMGFFQCLYFILHTFICSTIV